MTAFAATCPATRDPPQLADLAQLTLRNRRYHGRYTALFIDLHCTVYNTTQLTNCSSATRRSVPGELPEQRVEVRAEGAAPPGPARTSRPSVADCRRSSIRHANLATPQRLRLSEACGPAARPSRDRLLGAEQKRAAAAAMVMQGICAAPRGIALRNTFINSIWETPSINNPLPRDYPPPQNTGHKSVARLSPTQPPTTFYDETETNEIISSHSCTLYQCNETSRTSQEDRMPVIPLTRVAGM